MRDIRRRIDKLEREGGDPVIVLLWAEDGESRESLDKRGAEKLGMSVEQYRAAVESDAVRVVIVGFASDGDAPK